eukprot:3301530-Rhodomonas_salina.1
MSREGKKESQHLAVKERVDHPASNQTLRLRQYRTSHRARIGKYPCALSVQNMLRQTVPRHYASTQHSAICIRPRYARSVLDLA